jgi:hypothetical protein
MNIRELGHMAGMADVGLLGGVILGVATTILNDRRKGRKLVRETEAFLVRRSLAR